MGRECQQNSANLGCLLKNQTIFRICLIKSSINAIKMIKQCVSTKENKQKARKNIPETCKKQPKNMKKTDKAVLKLDKIKQTSRFKSIS